MHQLLFVLTYLSLFLHPVLAIRQRRQIFDEICGDPVTVTVTVTNPPVTITVTNTATADPPVTVTISVTPTAPPQSTGAVDPTNLSTLSDGSPMSGSSTDPGTVRGSTTTAQIVTQTTSNDAPRVTTTGTTNGEDLSTATALPTDGTSLPACSVSAPPATVTVTNVVIKTITGYAPPTTSSI